MLRHYITVALRNLLKHKGQTLISIIGLAKLFLFHNRQLLQPDQGVQHPKRYRRRAEKPVLPTFL